MSRQIINKYVSSKTKTIVEDNLILFEVPVSDISKTCAKFYKTQKLPLKIVFAQDNLKVDKSFKIFYVFSVPNSKYFLAPFIKLQKTTEFPSLTSIIHELSWYEREIYTFFGLTPKNYPGKLQPLILHDNWPTNTYPLRKDFKWNTRPPFDKKHTYQFSEIKGEGIYELPVGPIHAGIIEPGHFRFSLAGEEIIALEPQLGYVHKGIEKLFETLTLEEKVKLSERVSGDSSFSHSLAFCQAVENLAGIEVPRKARYLRTIFAELERISSHFNDLGFIMNDTAFTFGGSQGTRLKETVMQINEVLTGSRFLRGVNKIGGVSADILDPQVLLTQLEELEKDYIEVLEIAEDNTSMINRLKGSGVLNKQIGIDHGIVGVAARALGLLKDVRVEHPYAAYTELKVKVALYQTGDVYARFKVRAEEIYNSLDLIKQALRKLTTDPINLEKNINLKPNSYRIGITEDRKGEIVYVVATDENGDITRVALRDPSYLNWPAVPYAVVGNPVPEFPLINKSFNLSYSGNDK